MTASTTSEPMNPGVPVIAPVESVNQRVRVLEEVPPAPMPMMRAVIWRLRSTSGTSKAMISTEAITSVQDSSQPRNGCTMRIVNTKAMMSTEAMTSVHASNQPRNGCVMRLVNT